MLCARFLGELAEFAAAAPQGRLHCLGRSIVTDDRLRVLGTEGAIWALGDAATVDQPRALEHAQELFEQADTDADGILTLAELERIMTAASRHYSHLAEHAQFLAT